jgi:hypothetical protein
MRTDKARRVAALTGIAVAAAIAIWTHLGGGENRPADSRPPTRDVATRSESRQAITVSVDELATSGPGGPQNARELDGLPPVGFIDRQRPHVLRVARRFLDGYFAFEVRQDWRWGARQVAATATPNLAAQLLAGGAALPPVMDEFPPRAEVYAIDVEFDKPATVAQARAEVTRGSDHSDIGVIAERRETRWVITKITE